MNHQEAIDNLREILAFVENRATALEKLQAWKDSGQKGRWCRIEIDTSYGATCWKVELGNIAIVAKPGWVTQPKDKTAVIYAAECAFTTGPGSLPENVVYVHDEEKDDDCWVGLERVILAALERAEKLGV